MKTLIIGAGPAGLFCAEELLRKGHAANEIMIVDSGLPMQERQCPRSKKCDCETCDILEGVGGAGGFSDGKMTLSLDRGTQTESIFRSEDESILALIDDKMIEYGGEGKYYKPVAEDAKSDFYDKVESAGFKFGTYKLRHFGSDGARRMIINQEMSLRSRGVKFLLSTKVNGLMWYNDCRSDAKVIGAYMSTRCEDHCVLADHIIIATGLQGEPWVREQASLMGIDLLGGPAGIGMRLETPAENLSALFDTFYDFKLELETPIGQLRSFCCNREGYIVNENHKELMIRNVNGHSNLSANLKSKSSNFAIIAKVNSDQTGDVSPQEWVRTVACQINQAANGLPIVQYASDFINGIASDAGALEVNPVRTNRQTCAGIDMSRHMPTDLRRSFSQFLITLDDVLPHGLDEDAIVYGPEIKYYGNRFPVDNNWASIDAENLYVVGNASGYLDSYVAAAASGVIAARDIMK